MAKCLVVGGNGFLGSHLVDELVHLGHEVTVFDRFEPRRPNYSSVGVEAIRGDFLAATDLTSALRGQHLLFHCLSTTTPATTEDDPSLDVRTNIAQTVVLLDSAVKAGIDKVHFMSTGGAMYGDVADERISELQMPSPVSPYAIGKLAIEGYLRYFHRKHGLESVAYRLSNPYGARQHPGRSQGVIPIFLRQIAAGLPITVLGDGSMVRDYIYAQDSARMIARTVGLPTQHPVYNIGSGVGTSIQALVELAGRVTGRDVLTRSVPSPSTFVDRVVLDISRYTDEFGAEHVLGIEDGVARTWAEILAESG